MGKSIFKIPKSPSFSPLALKRTSCLNFRKILRFCMENVAREQDVALQRLFSYKPSYFFFKKNTDHQNISFFNDGDLKLVYFNIFNRLFLFMELVKS